MDQDRPPRRRRRSGEDHISGLPDELPHSILLRLGSARAAARTSVLSRRWRPVWAHLPELVFGNGNHGTPPPPPPPASSFLDAVDDTLAAYAAPTLEALVVVLPTAGDGSPNVPARRVAPWLRFAAERVAGGLVLFTPPPWSMLPPHELQVDWEEEEAVLELPTCRRAKTITLRLKQDWRLRLRPTGLFTALTSLRILFGRMEGSELTDFVCTRCPCLRELRLSLMLVHASDISIHSDSLQLLSFSVKETRRLEVVTPKLEYLYVGEATDEARISAPKLARVVWSCANYDPNCHRFEGVGHHLRLLDIRGNSAVGLLTQRFNEVDELKLGIYISREIAAYESFLNEINKLPKCTTLGITLVLNHHGLTPVMLHLLRCCGSAKKVSIHLFGPSDYTLGCPCQPSCPCRLEENRRIDSTDLISLEEVEITSYKTFEEELLEFVEQLSRCNEPI